jgi:hypothetical protein
MVRLRLLALTSMLFVGLMHISPVIGMGNEKNPLLHAETECALCKTSIKDIQWPEVLAVECDDDCHHAILGHRACIESAKETYTCNKEHEGKQCGARLSDHSKRCIDQTKHIVDTEKAHIPDQRAVERNPRNKKHALFQWYSAYKDKEQCPICLGSLVGKRWPDIVVLHCGENQVGHTYCTDCAHDLITRNQPCSTCRTPLSVASRNPVGEARGAFGQKDPLHPWYLQRHESVKGSIATRANASMQHLKNAMQYRLLRYPVLCATSVLALYGLYMYSNAESLSVSEAVTGMRNATGAGGCIGLAAALLHYAHDWYTKK